MTEKAIIISEQGKRLLEAALNEIGKEIAEYGRFRARAFIPSEGGPVKSVCLREIAAELVPGFKKDNDHAADRKQYRSHFRGLAFKIFYMKVRCDSPSAYVILQPVNSRTFSAIIMDRLLSDPVTVYYNLGKPPILPIRRPDVFSGLCPVLVNQ